MDIKKKLQQVPSSPGIYIMKGYKDRIVYVGKAKNLKNRLRSYFQDSSILDARKAKMIKEIRNFDYVVAKNEFEALVLEANYIKRSKPKYNIILRDDKNYPYLKLTVNEQWPRLEVSRGVAKDSVLYFGPYVPAGGMWEILKFIRLNFTLRKCRYNLNKPLRPCIQHQMAKCLAPCAENFRDKTDRNRYMEVVNEVKLFLQGKKGELLSSLRKKMQQHSENLQFEEAAKIRDRLKTLEKALESQRVIAPELGDMDVIGLYRENQEASIFMLFIRNGMVIGQKDFFLKKLGGIENHNLISNFIEQFYSKEIILPPKIILPLKGEFRTQRLWLSKKRSDTVTLSTSKNKKESGVLKMASDNAYHSFCAHKEIKTSSTSRETLVSLKEFLNLKTIPKRIEAIDVSNIAGSEAVGALIVWEDGKFIKNDYRLFKIKTVEGIDDFAMSGEVVGRHFKKLSGKGGKLPQLILIDGGRGQLSSAVKAMKHFELPIEITALAKAKKGLADRVYLPMKTSAIPLEPFTSTTHLLQRIRNEAHRFAISFHKKLRTKRVLESPLEKISGIGKTRRLLLLRHFGSIDSIKKATIDEIASIRGLNRKTAELLKTSLGGSI
ncbi:MAG: excinuclease ABC subunit UvrC [Thermodesulfovibrionia bacterium]